MNNSDYKLIIRRLGKLEQAVFSNRSKTYIKENISVKNKNFSGATGGIRFLVTRGFFRSKKNLSEVREELEKHRYPYSSQAIDMALKRLSKPKGLLVRLEIKGQKMYAERK